MIAEAKGQTVTESPEQLTERAKAAMDKYDADGNRSIKLMEFIRMLGDPPYLSLIPDEMVAKMPALALEAAAALEAVRPRAQSHRLASVQCTLSQPVIEQVGDVSKWCEPVM